MPSSPEKPPAPPAKVPLHGFHLLSEPDPWLRSFLRNLGDLFRPEPPKVWMTASPGAYWPDALVHRPVAWTRMVQSYLGHALVLACAYAGNLYWLNQPHVIVEEPPQTTTMLQYPLSEYVPEVKPKATQDVPVRERAQKADPVLSPQKIVSLNVGHTSTQQTIVQPDPRLLQQDVPLPNIVAWTAVPIAPIVTHQRTIDLPSGAPEIAPPAQQAIEHNVSQLTFPAPQQPQVIAPASPIAANLQAPHIIAMPGPVVVPPAEDLARRDASQLQLQAQAPPQVAGPSTVAIARSNFALLTPAVQPAVVPPAPSAAQHNLGALGSLGQGQGPAVVPPAQPIAGMEKTHAQEAGQLLALNVRPLPPSGPVTVPEGRRKGEFAAGPDGHVGASGRPEIRKGTGLPSTANHSGAGNGPAGVSVDAPPAKVTSNIGASAKLAPPVAMNESTGGTASADLPNSDRIDNAIFGGRRRYSMHLNMPNLNSVMGSWTVRFAELNGNPADHSELTAPEAIRKVDPAYPANLMREQIEGVVVLHAIIRSDGSVDDVRVLEGFYQQLDENARAALAQWRFLPGAKNGVPVDVEAVFRVPFRVSKFSF